jgi:hypothetical protein
MGYFPRLRKTFDLQQSVGPFDFGTCNVSRRNVAFKFDAPIRDRADPASSTCGPDELKMKAFAWGFFAV